MGPVHLPPVSSPDAEARRAAVARYAELAVPAGALGRLAELGCWLAAAQGTCPPRPPGRPRVVLVAADHGVAAAGVSAYPSDVTARQVVAAREQTTPATVLALAAGASVRVVDVAVDHSPDAPPPGSVLAPDPRYRVGSGSGRIDRADALTDDETARALEVGRLLVDEEVEPDLVVLDVMLPGFDGLEVCRRLHARRPVPVLMLTARDAETDMLVGLGVGADDYMTKPFSIRELVARVHALLRRVERAAQAGGDRRIVLGELEIDLAQRRVTRRGEPAHLTPIEFDLLLHLAGRPRTVLPREALLAQVWGWSNATGTRTVDSHVKALRRKLGADLIRTVHGVRYALEVPR